MKKISAFMIVAITLLLICYSPVSAESYFSNNKALDSTFSKMEKTFLKYEIDETIPLKEMQIIGTKEEEKDIKPRPKKKITGAQVRAAAEKRLNTIKVAVEIKEEELGGLTQQDYKTISEQFDWKLFFAKRSSFGWDYDAKIVSLYLDTSSSNELENITGLTGNFANMGVEKDEVYPEDLRVSGKITRYLKQSMQKGNKVDSEILAKLPGEVEKLFIESNLSRIEAGRLLANIHKDIYTPNPFNSSDADNYDGSKSLESIIESYTYDIKNCRDSREDEKKIEYYRYTADEPSAENKANITKRIVNETLPESFTYGFNKQVTLDELARLYFGSRELDDKIEIEDNLIDAESPDYIKMAFIYGMINSGDDLQKPMTRLEAARRLVNGITEFSDVLRVTDCSKIPIDDFVNVASCLSSGMKTRVSKFEPQGSYTKQEAIVDNGNTFGFHYLRGFEVPFDLQSATKVIVGKNTIHLLFDDNDQIKEYITENFKYTPIEKIKQTGSYMKIDIGGALLELFTPEGGIKFTMKNGVRYIDYEEGDYGGCLSRYKIEPKVLKANEKIDMNIQPDSINRKLNAKLDAILAKIIKPGMTQEQKVKAIHDFVVKHITYDTKYKKEITAESIIETIDKGRGVCGNYSILFMKLCRRASITCMYEADYFTMDHAWNAVFINGEWKFVDTTWDDSKNGKVLYTYFLKDRFTFMRDHIPVAGIPDEDYYSDSDINRLGISDQDELRAYLLKNFYWVDGYKLTFRMADKKMKPFIGYLWTTREIRKIELTYDSKNNLYTVTAKAK
jgi:hypothetical protein